MRALFLLPLLACAPMPHVDPQPRSSFAASFTVARVDVLCSELDPLDPGLSPDEGSPHQTWPTLVWGGGTGTGVVISERHVLTAAHVVACPVLPFVRVTLSDGRWFHANVERDAGMFGDGTDLARLEISTAETFGVGIAPPVIAPFIWNYAHWCAYTRHGPACGMVADPAVPNFTGITRPGDSGSPVYDERGELVGLVVGGNALTTRIARVTPYWLEGT